MGYAQLRTDAQRVLSRLYGKEETSLLDEVITFDPNDEFIEHLAKVVPTLLRG